ncbi:hypothetical protein IFM89_001605 [Coptis chinensis]|uniref:CCHC-type domain-containing protein n=1 Tax=Coptis chinensis TaxID=261450 RepID=A0A835HJU4_9MAGN|nr:hypothetical protein IFM89_001605 [Coptis chinensis]
MKKNLPIEMPIELPFSVDTWSPSSDRKRHHFLTHAHKDHSSGITAHASYPIYSTHVTKTIVLQQYPQLDASLFVEIEIGGKVVIEDPDGTFSVSAFDANHCPGAIMFLFEGNFGNILHTGDCRLTPECLQNLPEKYVGEKEREPNIRTKILKRFVMEQVINCIWEHPNAPVVYLTCNLLAQDKLLVEVSRTFGSKVYVDRINNAECFQALTITAPEVLTEDESSRFQIFEVFYKFYEKARAKLEAARLNFQPEPLFIRPSVQWYVFEEDPETGSQRKEMPTGAKKDSFGVWHICYSSHSSREELERALQLLQPKKVVSTTPSCSAMELNYVKKHCLNSQVSSDGQAITVDKAQPHQGSGRDRDDDRNHGRDRDYGSSRGGRGGGGGGECFECRKPGHFAGECPGNDGGRGGRYGRKDDKYGGGGDGGGRYSGGPDRNGDRYNGGRRKDFGSRDRDDDRDHGRDRDYGSSRGGGGGECFKCGKPGHFARECPSGDDGGRGGRYGRKDDKYGGGGDGGGRYSGGPDRNGDRYNGGRRKDFGSRDRDDDRDHGRDRDYGSSRGGGGGECFKCGKPGHFARECPSGDDGGRGGRYGGRDDGSGGGGRGRYSGGPYRNGDPYSRGRSKDSGSRGASGSDRNNRDRVGPYERRGYRS